MEAGNPSEDVSCAKLSMPRPHVRLDERLRLRDNDAVAVETKPSHSGGTPMSQRECAGFNWPPLNASGYFWIAARNPLGISPKSTDRASSSVRRELSVLPAAL